MSDDDVDHELVALLRQKFGLGGLNPNAPPETKVLEHAQFVTDNSIDVALSMQHTKLAAIAVREEMQKREYTTKTWAEHELHPKSKDEATLNFIFTMDLLNFSFWSEKSAEERYTVSYKGKRWTGYWSLVASLQRALDEGIPITDPEFWIDDGKHSGEMTKDASSSQQNGGAVSTDNNAPPPWTDPEAPRLGNGAFDTGVYDDPPSEQQTDEAKPAIAEPVQEQSLEIPSGSAPNALVHNEAVIESQRKAVEDPKQVKVEDITASEYTPGHVSQPEQNELLEPAQQLRCTEELLRHVFRSETAEEIPMFEQRVQCLREAGEILHEQFDGSVATLIGDTKGSAAGLVNLLADRFPCFRDEATFERKKVRFLKRAQIFVADLWAAFEGEGYGAFNDIDKITMFADYRVPQILHSLGLISYCPPLEARIRRGEIIPPGHPWEIQIRGCSIWAVELLRREILKVQPDAKINAILLDFFLYDLAKEKESAGEEALPHHRTRSIWY